MACPPPPADGILTDFDWRAVSVVGTNYMSKIPSVLSSQSSSSSASAKQQNPKGSKKSLDEEATNTGLSLLQLRFDVSRLCSPPPLPAEGPVVPLEGDIVTSVSDSLLVELTPSELDCWIQQLYLVHKELQKYEENTSAGGEEA